MQKVYLKESTMHTLIDDADYEKVRRFDWYLLFDKDTDMYYAYREVTTADGRKSRQLMHRFILGLKNGNPRVVEHKDDDGLNNQRDNLKIVTRTENQTRRVVTKNSESGFIGVSRIKSSGKWYGHITLHNHTYSLGTYPTKYECAEARTYAETIVFKGRGRNSEIPIAERPGPELTNRIHREVDKKLARQGFTIPEKTGIAEAAGGSVPNYPDSHRDNDVSTEPTETRQTRPPAARDRRETPPSAA